MAEMDAQTLDREYNTFLTAGDFDKSSFGRRSREAMKRVERIADIVYDPSSNSKLDFFPAGQGAPLFVWIHGGYWRASTKDEHVFIAPGLVSKGISVASIDYTLAPHANLDEIVRQVRQSIAWLHRHAPEYGADCRRLHIGGHSAGGHLTAMLCVGDWHSGFGLPHDIIATALTISGLFELAPLRHTSVNVELQFDDGLIERNSPIRHVRPSSTDLILTYGGRESSEFQRQTQSFAAVWRAHGNRVGVVEMADFHHFDIVLELEAPGNPLFDTLVEHIGNVG